MPWGKAGKGNHHGRNSFDIREYHIRFEKRETAAVCQETGCCGTDHLSSGKIRHGAGKGPRDPP